MEYYNKSNQPQQNKKIWNNMTDNLCPPYPLDKMSLSIHRNSNQNNRYRNSIIKAICNKEHYKTFSMIDQKKRFCCQPILTNSLSIEKILIILFYHNLGLSNTHFGTIILFCCSEILYYSQYCSISRCLYSSDILIA